MRNFTALALIALAAVVASGCQRDAAPAPPPSPAQAAEASFGSLEREYAIYVMTRFPVVGTYLGGAGFDPALADIDGKLRDHSPAALEEEDVQLAAFRQRFASLDATALSAPRRIDRSVALAQIEFLLHQHQVLHHQHRAIDSYVDEPFRGIDWQIQGMPVADGKLGTAQDWRAVVARVRAVPRYLDVARGQLEAGVAAGDPPDWRVLQQFGLQGAAANVEYFANTLPELARSNLTGAERDAVLEELGSACAAASLAFAGFRDFIATTFFETRRGNADLVPRREFRTDRFAAGEEAYDWALRNNLRLDTTAAELYDASWSIVLDTQRQMVELAQRIASAHRWKVPEGTSGVLAVLAKLGLEGPTSDAAMLAAYRATGERLVDYARRTQLFDVPTDYALDVVLTPPPLQSSIDGAAYYPAPVFKRTGVGRFYVTPTNDNVDALRQLHNLAALPDLAAHEGFPGHDWHYKVMGQYRDGISPIRWLTPGAVEDSSSMWQDSLAAEGWALYAEGLLAEPRQGEPDGFYSPEQHLYQLQGLLYRDLRVRLDTGLHTGRLSFEDAVTLFSEVVDFQPGACTDKRALRSAAKRTSCDAARGAISRYARWPTQAITYRLGKDQILALRAKAQTQLGARFSLQRFHIEFMKQGTIPANYFADELLLALGAPE